MTGLVILLIAALLLAAFASSAETALNSASRTRMRSLADDGNRRAARVVRIHTDPNPYLSTVLTLNTVALIAATTAAVSIAGQVLPNVSDLVTDIVLTIVALVACEIATKSFALAYSDRFALAVAGPVTLLTRLLNPIVFALTWVGTLPVRLATRGRTVRGPFVTEEELKLMVTIGEQQGVVEEEEREMIHNILEMTDKSVREVMVPRVDVVGIEATRAIDEAIKLIVETGHSRIPVHQDTIDNITGVLYAKDVLHMRDRRVGSVGDLAREPHFTPEAKKAGELLLEMQQQRNHMVIVVDEYGGTAGIVTIEDLIEEIVGPIRDEYDLLEEEDIRFESDHEAVVNARVSLDEVNERLGFQVEEEDVDSIGGLVYARLGEIPKVGDAVTIEGATITVTAVRRQSIRTLRIARDQPFTTRQREQRVGGGNGAAAVVHEEESA